MVPCNHSVRRAGRALRRRRSRRGSTWGPRLAPLRLTGLFALAAEPFRDRTPLVRRKTGFAHGPPGIGEIITRHTPCPAEVFRRGVPPRPNRTAQASPRPDGPDLEQALDRDAFSLLRAVPCAL